tara:strand:+ start:742 stop:1068 length:327 start_codon:yes stop_codon:yes gene_type:complete
MFDRTTTDLLMSKRQHIMRVLKEMGNIDCYAIGHTDLAVVLQMPITSQDRDVEIVGMTNGGFQITYKGHWMLDSAECQAFNDSLRASFYMGCDEVMTWVEMILDEITD